MVERRTGRINANVNLNLLRISTDGENTDMHILV